MLYSKALIDGIDDMPAADPQVLATIQRAGSPVEYQDAPEFQAYWDQDITAMVDAVRRIGKVE